MNVLLSCVGRRGYLVEYFRHAVAPNGKVVATNSTSGTAGLFAADRSFVVPVVTSPDYISVLLDIARTERVGLVVSLFDIDLPVLAGARDRFLEEGIEVVVSEPDVVSIVNDKWRTYRFLIENDIPTPQCYVDMAEAKAALAAGQVGFPLIVKPRWGMGSISVFRADTVDELRHLYAYSTRQIEYTYLNILSAADKARSVLIQEFVEGPEYGVDLFNDLHGNHLATVVKRKLAMRAGETDVAETVAAPQIEAVCTRLAQLLRHRGNMDIDILWPEGGEPHILELNARFGGGYPFSHMAGASFPKALVQMAEGKPPEVGTIEIGVRGLKAIQPLRVDGKSAARASGRV